MRNRGLVRVQLWDWVVLAKIARRRRITLGQALEVVLGEVLR